MMMQTLIGRFKIKLNSSTLCPQALMMGIRERLGTICTSYNDLVDPDMKGTNGDPGFGS